VRHITPNITQVPTSFRIPKINKLIHQELSQRILREINLPPDCFVTVTDVDTTRDLGQCKIKVSVFPADKSELTLAHINKKSGYFRGILGRSLKMYKIPRLIFVLDTAPEQVTQIDQLIDKIHQEE